ncbi:hypothetical protein C1N81_05775 [Streptomyces sp. SGAir0957]
MASLTAAAEQALAELTAMRITREAQAQWDAVLAEYREINDAQTQQRLLRWQRSSTERDPGTGPSPQQSTASASCRRPPKH